MGNLKNKFDVNFVVFSQIPHHIDYIGSSTVSHTLARELSLLGENTFIYANDTPHKSVSCIPWGNEIEYDNENTIFIMPAGAGEHTFKQDIPKSVEIIFLEKVRDNKKFDKFEDLKNQIKDDIDKSLEWFEEKK